MAISKIKTGSITDSAITEAKLGCNAVTTGKISDGTIVNADISPSAAIASSKTVICTAVTDTNAFNISLLGFKMAVNEGLTVFNLVDGVVDEFHDESGTDEAEGSNDTYCATSDYYINSTSPGGISICTSAGFSTTAVTEGDTSTAGTNPTYGTATNHTYTVPTGASSVNFFLWGASGGTGDDNVYPSAGAGFTTGALAVTAGQSIYVGVAEAGMAGGQQGGPTTYGGAGLAHGGDAGDGPPSSSHGAGAGGGSGIASTNAQGPQWSAPQAPAIFGVAAGGAGGGNQKYAGAGGGLVGSAGQHTYPGPATSFNAQTSYAPFPSGYYGGGGDQEQGGQGVGPGDGAFMQGGKSGESNCTGQYDGGGGGGYYGGAAGHNAGGGGGSSYYGHPQVTSGSTQAGNIEADSGSEAGEGGEPGGDDNPLYPQTSTAGQGSGVNNEHGKDGYVFITASVSATTTSTTIVSEPFTSTSVPTTSRIVVFEENVGTPTLNTDIIASISRDGGSNFTTATLSDSGYVTGSSGQRILTGQATISGQPSGQSMRWKLALANNAVKIHGVSLQWA